MADHAHKNELLARLKTTLEEELERATRHALDAAEATTHEENRAEGDKDMRSTESSYVARGQALRVRELEAALAQLAVMPVRDFAAEEPIGVSALVDVAPSARGSRTTYLLVTAGGGQRLDKVLTLATTSPMGAALLGLHVGDEVEVSTPQGLRQLLVKSVR